MRRFVALDRDGTLIVERHYLAEPAGVQLLAGAGASLRHLRSLGCGLFVVTNQSGIGRGFFSESQVELVHRRLRELLAAEGVQLDGIYVCPHTPADGCPCRKPGVALMERAASELGFDPREAFVVGDKECDIEMGRRVGATTLLVRTGYGEQVVREARVAPDVVVDGLVEAAEIIGARVGRDGGGVLMSARASGRSWALAHLMDSAEVKRQVAERCMGALLAAADLIAETFRAGGKVLLCGNGGSAADCQHMATEFVSRLRKDFERPALPAIALTTDTSFLTAFANDCGFDGVFERQVGALGRPGDLLVAISTSGNSANVVRAVETALVSGIRVVVLTGTGGRLASQGDVVISVPSSNTQYIQEAHLAIEHVLCELVEQALFTDSGERRGWWKDEALSGRVEEKLAGLSTGVQP